MRLRARFRSGPATAARAASSPCLPRGRPWSRRAPGRSCVAPAETGDGDLVERSLLNARCLALVLAAVALAQADQHLVLAGGGGKLGVALRQLALTLLQLAGS